MKKTLLLSAMVIFSGCDVNTHANDPSTVSPVKASYLSKNAIYFPGGTGIQFSGRLRSYEFVENDKGMFDRYIFEFSEDTMAVEGSVFAILAKSGYQRKIREENETAFVVNYVKEGSETVYMTYERVPADGNVAAFTRLRIVWKEA